MQHGGVGKPATMKTGPKDTSGIVWALGKFFFSIFFHIFLLLTMVLHIQFLQVNYEAEKYYEDRDRGEGDE